MDGSTENAFRQLENYTSTFSLGVVDIIRIIVAAGLAVALVFVIYEIANNKPRAKEYGVAWFIALILYLIFLKY